MRYAASLAVMLALMTTSALADPIVDEKSTTETSITMDGNAYLIRTINRRHDIASFFDQIARLPRIINITDLEMTIGKESSTATLLTVEGKATTFRFVEPDPEPKAADPKAAGKGRGARKGAGKGAAAQGGAR